MICSEYFPAYTHSYDADCNNCEWKSIYGMPCRNPKVRMAFITKEIK